MTVLSGHDAAGTGHDPAGWQNLDRGGGTLVVLMGVSALPAITGGLLAGGASSRRR